MTNSTDQKIGRDVTERYAELRKQIDAVTADLDRTLGPIGVAELNRFRDGTGRSAVSDEDETNDG